MINSYNLKPLQTNLLTKKKKMVLPFLQASASPSWFGTMYIPQDFIILFMVYFPFLQLGGTQGSRKLPSTGYYLSLFSDLIKHYPTMVLKH